MQPSLQTSQLANPGTIFFQAQDSSRVLPQFPSPFTSQLRLPPPINLPFQVQDVPTNLTSQASTVQTSSQVFFQQSSQEGISRKRMKSAPLDPSLQNPNHYYCNQCPAHFKNASDLRGHQKERCGQMEKKYSCDLCAEKFYFKKG